MKSSINTPTNTPPNSHSPSTLLSTLLSLTEKSIIPLTAAGVKSGSKLFGAAILSRSNLTPLTVATNNEQASPLLHGEINCIQQFFSTLPPSTRPPTKDCIFFATHEPCSLCLSGITWAGFNEFYYLFTYQDSRDLFGIPHDIDILEQVFRVPGKGDDEQSLRGRPLYNRNNKFFRSKSLADLIEELELDGEEEKGKWRGEIRRMKELYTGLSETYQEGKRKGAESSSVWK
ncbi:cytidine deaminase-like protein [Triangularia verruculosa]|uniref:Cytidine deaminase-like protein n=1 Tax=Triangularia verruculosa TaxID=2587418 RepID=A0AAN6X6J3_9PEZI|nr:cytidine deaminase-like protein [Triangularia verruculosa]